jgi:hypothetical protein
MHKQCLYLLSVRTQISEHYTFNCHLLHVSAVFGYHQVDYTTYMEKNTDVAALFVKIMHTHLSIQQKWPTSLEKPDVGKTGCSVPHGIIGKQNGLPPRYRKLHDSVIPYRKWSLMPWFWLLSRRSHFPVNPCVSNSWREDGRKRSSYSTATRITTPTFNLLQRDLKMFH